MIYFIIIIIYVLSAYFNWLWVSLAHSKGGIYSSIYPDSGDLVICFMPVLNTAFCISMWLGNWPIEKEEKEKLLDKFFKVKK